MKQSDSKVACANFSVRNVLAIGLIITPMVFWGGEACGQDAPSRKKIERLIQYAAERYRAADVERLLGIKLTKLVGSGGTDAQYRESSYSYVGNFWRVGVNTIDSATDYRFSITVNFAKQERDSCLTLRDAEAMLLRRGWKNIDEAVGRDHHVVEAQRSGLTALFDEDGGDDVGIKMPDWRLSGDAWRVQCIDSLLIRTADK